VDELSNNLDLQELEIEAERLTASTARQRHALYRLGKSRSFVKKYADTKTTAAKLIQRGIEEMTELKQEK